MNSPPMVAQTVQVHQVPSSMYENQDQQMSPGMTVFVIGLLLVIFGLIFVWIPPMIFLMYVGILVWLIGGIATIAKKNSNRDGAWLSLVCAAICLVVHAILIVASVIIMISSSHH